MDKTRQASTGMRKGFTMIELIISIVVISLGVWIVMVGYPKIKTSMNAKNALTQATTVVGAFDEYKNSYNNGAYMATTSKTIATIPLMKDLMGGANGIADVSGWRYGCTAGTASTASIITTNYESPEIARLAAKQISANLGWTATAAGSAVTMSKANVVCK